MDDLFTRASPLQTGGDGECDGHRPLADRLRPAEFSQFVGQSRLLGENSVLRRLIDGDRIPSMIFWGPPGSGKTTLAHIIARHTRMRFHTLSAVTAGIREVKGLMDTARSGFHNDGRRTILFIDEIHRFNKAQQDAFLPFVEDGTIILIGATTENPSFSVISPLLSRCRVFVLEALKEEHLQQILERALTDESSGLGRMGVTCTADARALIISLSDGDARRTLNLLEHCAQAVSGGSEEITPAVVKDLVQKAHLLYDKKGEEHYNLISAFHKSLRGSDPDAALYWLGRMIAAGEDPLFVARRMIRFASEDIGNADPQALLVSLGAWDSYNRLGSPEGELALAQAAVYLATAPKSNSAYAAWSRVMETIEKTGSLPAPFVIRNAPTKLMKDLGYGRGYQYDHDSPDHYMPQDYLPEDISRERFYEPGPFGFEREIRKRMDWWDKKKREKRGGDPGAGNSI